MDKIIFFAILVVFPFGQLLKIGMFNLFDVLVLLLSIITVSRKPIYPNWYKHFLTFLLFALFTCVINFFIFKNNTDLFLGLIYLIRLLSYSFLSIYVFNEYRNKEKVNSLMTKLLGISVAAAVFGWIQYILYPDLTSFKYFGWDDHLLRMVGTFLDPTYLGLVLILGALLAIFKNKNAILYFLSISVAFTYSRISFLILVLLLVFKKKYLALFIFVLSVLLLPKMIGEGTNLTRTASGINKLGNYEETIKIIKTSPLFGVGYNNICFARKFYLNEVNTKSHACSGSDSSILFILATTGIIGLILFIYFILQVPRNTILVISFFAVLVHSIFSNSLFYPHIMFWLFILIGLKGEVNRKST